MSQIAKMLKKRHHRPLCQILINRLAGLWPIGYPVTIWNFLSKQKLFHLTHIHDNRAGFGKGWTIAGLIDGLTDIRSEPSPRAWDSLMFRCVSVSNFWSVSFFSVPSCLATLAALGSKVMPQNSYLVHLLATDLLTQSPCSNYPLLNWNASAKLLMASTSQSWHQTGSCKLDI